MQPHRIQLSRVKGWRMPAGAVKVDRSTRWGNPYVVWPDSGTWCVSWGGAHYEAASRQDAHRLAVALFREIFAGPYLVSHLGGYPLHTDIIKSLRGKNLACWCALNEPCHADVLLEIANGPLCEAVP